MDPLDAIDRALGRSGKPPAPLWTGVAANVRDARLRSKLCHPDEDLPTGELAEWALVLPELGKEVVVMAAVAAVETARSQRRDGADLAFVDEVLAAVRSWRDGPQGIDDLAQLGQLWWRLVRNPPVAAQTPLGDAAFMMWYVAGYDPEGWGKPPTDPAKLDLWLREAADNRGAIVDVFGLAEKAAGPEPVGALVRAVRAAVSEWRGRHG